MRGSRQLLVAVGMACMCVPALDARGKATTMEGYWEAAESDAILDKTLRLRLAPDLSHLSEGEREVVERLLQVGNIMQRLFEASTHHQSLAVLADLQALDRMMGSSAQTKKLLDLYRLFKGPIATDLDNQRTAFLPVDPETPGKNVYPPGITRDEVVAFLEGHPEQRREILHLRSVVRRSEKSNLKADLAKLAAYPAQDALHPGLRGRLQALLSGESEQQLYAVPYSLAYAEELFACFRLLTEAAKFVQEDDPDLASYLANRARDLLADDYEAGDASWVTGQFRNLNAQIGSYETYDDALFGVKSFFSLSLLVRDQERSRKLAEAIGGLQELQDALPYSGSKKVREAIPVGIYDVVADFGQARTTNTATILPNESRHARKYGRTILMRQNILRNPELFALSRASFAAAVVPEQAGDLRPDGNFERTLWHEIGHYLGPDRALDGRELDVALDRFSDLYEEMKSDLVSLFAAPSLRERDYLDDVGLRSFYASGIRRVVQNVKPRREQPYQTMQLMQMNFFLEAGLLRVEDGWLRIDYARYHATVRDLLGRVLAIQEAGDAGAAGEFVERYGGWDEDLHGVVARRMREAVPYRYRLVSYAALGE